MHEGTFYTFNTHLLVYRKLYDIFGYNIWFYSALFDYLLMSALCALLIFFLLKLIYYLDGLNGYEPD